MSQSDDKSIVYQILGYLESLKGTLSEGDSAKLDGAVDTIESIFDVSIKSVDSFKDYSYYPVTFNQIFDKGIETLKPRCFGETLIEAESNPKFNAFFNVVSEKGYYDNIDPDSIEYMTRHSKLIQKFNEKVSDTSAGKFLEYA